ncbi:hypothetical protein NMY22_g8512 [Coprinellus aureogranulatus]|nr:hypothetical protein NMY22_g8512 [Coprinellus aureogranulatus]
MLAVELGPGRVERFKSRCKYTCRLGFELNACSNEVIYKVQTISNEIDDGWAHQTRLLRTNVERRNEYSVIGPVYHVLESASISKLARLLQDTNPLRANANGGARPRQLCREIADKGFYTRCTGDISAYSSSMVESICLGRADTCPVKERKTHRELRRVTTPNSPLQNVAVCICLSSASTAITPPSQYHLNVPQFFNRDPQTHWQGPRTLRSLTKSRLGHLSAQTMAPISERNGEQRRDLVLGLAITAYPPAPALIAALASSRRSWKRHFESTLRSVMSMLWRHIQHVCPPASDKAKDVLTATMTTSSHLVGASQLFTPNFTCPPFAVLQYFILGCFDDANEDALQEGFKLQYKLLDKHRSTCTPRAASAFLKLYSDEDPFLAGAPSGYLLWQNQVGCGRIVNRTILRALLAVDMLTAICKWWRAEAHLACWLYEQQSAAAQGTGSFTPPSTDMSTWDLPMLLKAARHPGSVTGPAYQPQVRKIEGKTIYGIAWATQVCPTGRNSKPGPTALFNATWKALLASGSAQGWENVAAQIRSTHPGANITNIKNLIGCGNELVLSSLVIRFRHIRFPLCLVFVFDASLLLLFLLFHFRVPCAITLYFRHCITIRIRLKWVHSAVIPLSVLTQHTLHRLSDTRSKHLFSSSSKEVKTVQYCNRLFPMCNRSRRRRWSG